MGGYSLPSSSVCSSDVILLFCVSVMSSPSKSSVARRLPFHFVSTKLICECVGLKDRFGVPSDREDPVGDDGGGEDTTRWGGSIECDFLLISNIRSFVPFAHSSFLVLVSIVIFVVLFVVAVVVEIQELAMLFHELTKSQKPAHDSTLRTALGPWLRYSTSTELTFAVL